MSVASAGISNVSQPTPLTLTYKDLSGNFIDSATGVAPVYPLVMSDSNYIYSTIIVPPGQSLIVLYNSISIQNTDSTTHSVNNFITSLSETITSSSPITGSAVNNTTSQVYNTNVTAGFQYRNSNAHTCFYYNTSSSPKTLYVIFYWSNWNATMKLTSVNNSRVTVLGI